MINFLHTFIPQPILFELGPIKIHWYGFLMVVGGLVGFYVVLRLAKFYKIKKETLYDLAFYFTLAAVLGGRIYYVLYSWSYYKDNLFDIFKIWEGGLAVHGVLIGGFLAIYFFCRKKQLKFLTIADLAVAGFVIGQVIGRWGNYFNQEIFGLPTDLAWGIPIEVARRPLEYISARYFHPTCLYESFFNLIIFADVVALHYLKIKKAPAFLFDGAIFFYYIMAYSVLRFCLEFVRIDQSPLVFGIRWAQLFSALLFVGAAGIYVFLFVKKKKM